MTNVPGPQCPKCPPKCPFVSSKMSLSVPWPPRMALSLLTMTQCPGPSMPKMSPKMSSKMSLSVLQNVPRCPQKCPLVPKCPWPLLMSQGHRKATGPVFNVVLYHGVYTGKSVSMSAHHYIITSSCASLRSKIMNNEELVLYNITVCVIALPQFTMFVYSVEQSTVCVTS